MKIKHITRPLEIKAVQEDGTFDGYGSVFNVIDSYRDIVMPGAFAESIKSHKASKTMPALLWQHDSRDPIGIWTDMEEDAHGLKMTGKLAMGTQKGRETYELLKLGAVRGLSIGFNVPEGGEEFNEERSVWELSKINLWETSVVTFPANQEAQVTEVRAALEEGIFPSVRKLEEFLMRDAGFSRSQAQTIINHGYKSLTRDAESDIDIAKTLLKTLRD